MILSVMDVAFAYNGRPILQEVDFTLEEGELLAILGPNGVGKTTLLKCLNGIHRPASGAVMVEDRNVLKLKSHEIALGIGYVAQKNESARLSVFDAILMGRKPHIRWKIGEHDLKIVDSAIRRLGLERLTMRYLDQLSGGELQKVAIARAMVQEPRLMLLDEPTSALDLKGRMDILDMLRRLVDEHRIGAVMTMHDLNTALYYADKVLFLKDGFIYAVGPVAEVTPDVVEKVYGVPVHIQSIHGHPVVVPMNRN